MFKNIKEVIIIVICLVIYLFVAIFDGVKRLFKKVGDYLIDITMEEKNG